jgi:streptogramin lyase
MRGSVVHFNLQNPPYKTLVKMPITNEDLVEKNFSARRIKIDPNDRIWVFVENAGLYRYDGETWKFFELKDFGKDASAFAINSRGEVWAASRKSSLQIR